jgi:hypothetical protein
MRGQAEWDEAITDEPTMGQTMNDLRVITDEFGPLTEYLTAPPFWLAKPHQAMGFVQGLQAAQVRTIGRSAGGREILAIEYGEREPLTTTTDNLHSAIASKVVPPDPTEIFPEAFYGTTRRRRPVVVLQGGIHGCELTGTVASLNLCQLLETGTDLRGKAWPRLRELARETRLCIVPWLNIDGVVRTPWVHCSGMPAKVSQRINMGVATDGTRYRHPDVKRIFPIPPAQTALMGSYFNDAGVNLQYDFTSLHRQPETEAWMGYYLAERPDGVVIWHCNAGSLMGPPSHYLPIGYQIEEERLAGAVRGRLMRDGYPVGRTSWVGLPGLGKPYIEQMCAVYHVAGAMPLMVELPIGCQEYFYSLDDMLDVGLIVIEEILAFAHTDGLRPYETWSKVKRQMGVDD